MEEAKSEFDPKDISDEISETYDSLSKNGNEITLKKTKAIGKFDEWNRKKFENLQANTQQQLIEYQKLLAHYHDELERFKGTQPEQKKEIENFEELYKISNEEKTHSAEEYDNWSQKKFDELKENAQKQFYEYELLLERYKKQLDKFNFNNEHDSSIDNKENLKTDIGESIVEKIIYIISDFVKKIEKSKEVKQYIPKPQSELFYLKKDIDKKKFKWKNLKWRTIVGLLIVLISLFPILKGCTALI